MGLLDEVLDQVMAAVERVNRLAAEEFQPPPIDPEQAMAGVIAVWSGLVDVSLDVHADARGQLRAIDQALRAVLDHGEYKTFVHMRRKPLLDVMRVQQLNPAQLG